MIITLLGRVEHSLHKTLEIKKIDKIDCFCANCLQSGAKSCFSSSKPLLILQYQLQTFP